MGFVTRHSPNVPQGGAPYLGKLVSNSSNYGLL